MKQFFNYLSLCCALFFAGNPSLKAQLLNESFENPTFPPTGWVKYIGTNGLGAGQQWNRTDIVSTNPVQYTAVSFMTSGNPTNLMHEKWLVTPQLTPNATNNILSLKLRRTGFTPLFGKLSVRVSTTSQTSQASFTEVVFFSESAPGMNLTTYTTYTANLSVYNNQNIYVALVVVGNGDNGFYMDEVKDIPFTPTNAPVMSVTGNSTVINNGATSTGIANHTGFGIVITNTTDVERTYTIQNTGLTDLTFSGVPVVSLSGAGAAAFSVTQVPSSPVIATQSTTFKIKMLATASLGTKNAVVSIANNTSATNPFTFAIQGIIDPVPVPIIDIKGNNTLIPSGATTTSTANNTNFGNILLNSTATERTFTINNTGDMALNLTGNPIVSVLGADASLFTISQIPTSPVAVSGNVTFKISFNPTSIGTKNANISIANNSIATNPVTNPYTFAVSATVASPQINIKGNDTNITNGTTTITNLNHTNFNAIKLTLFVERTFTIENTGSVNLILTGTPQVALSGANASEFTVSAFPTNTTAGNSSTTFKIKLSPISLGTKTANVTISSNSATDAIYTFAIGGTGIPAPAPNIEVSGNSNFIASGSTVTATTNNTNFGSTKITLNTEKTFLIQNTGDANLSLLGVPIVALSGANASEFSVNQQAISPIGSLQSTLFKITFTPTSIGAKTALVTITNNSATASYTFVIGGNATPAPAPIIAITGNNNAIASGSTATANTNDTEFGYIIALPTNGIEKTYTIQNTGDAPLNLTAIPIVSISGANASDFTVTLAPTSPLAIGASTTFKIRYLPVTVLAKKTALVTIANNANTNYTFAIGGNDPILSVAPRLSVGTLSIYPNPNTTNQLTITLESSTQNSLTVAMTDIQGKTYFTKSIAVQNKRAYLGLNGAKSGLYLLKIQVGKEWIIQKIVVE